MQRGSEGTGTLGCGVTARSSASLRAPSDWAALRGDAVTAPARKVKPRVLHRVPVGEGATGSRGVRKEQRHGQGRMCLPGQRDADPGLSPCVHRLGTGEAKAMT